MQGNNSSPALIRGQEMTETLSSCLSRGIWREDRPGHAARIASEITSLGINTTGAKAYTGLSPPTAGVSEVERVLGRGDSRR